MKRMQFLRIVLLCVGVGAGLASCTKETLIEEAQDGATLQQAMDCNSPKFEANLQGSACTEGHTGGAWMMTSSTRNHLSWTLGADCPGNYNFYGVPVKYGLYKRTGTSSGCDIYTKVHEFTSMSTNMAYGGSAANLPNATKCVMLVQEVPTTSYPATLYRPTSDAFCTFFLTCGGPIYNASDGWCFTTGNGFGNACPPNSK